MDEFLITCDFNERETRAISSAIDYTLQKWAGEGFMDQETLFFLKSYFHAAVLEFNFENH